MQADRSAVQADRSAGLVGRQAALRGRPDSPAGLVGSLDRQWMPQHLGSPAGPVLRQTQTSRTGLVHR